MSHSHRRRPSRASAYWLKIALILFAILAIIIYFALSALLNKLPKIEYSIHSLTPTPSSGIYEPPLTSYVIAQEALLHPSIDPQSEVITRLIKDTPVLLLEFQAEWVKVQASNTDPISGWALRVAFAMNEPKPAPAATDSTPTHTPSPTVIVTLAMTPLLTATQAVTLPIAGTPTLAPTAQVTATVSITIPAPPTLIPPLELSPTPPILADAVVQASTLKLRSGPDERYTDAGEIQQNAVVKVIGKTQDCRWLYVVTSDGTQGWVPIGAVTLNMDCIQIPVAPSSSTPNALTGQTPQPNPQGADTARSSVGTGQNSSSQSSTSSSDTSLATPPEAKADLVVTAFTIRNIAENTITFDYTIANQGAIPVAMTTQSQPLGIAIHVFLSDSQGNELSQGQTLYPPALKGLAPGQAFSYAYPGTFASATRFNPTGTLHLTLVVDAENVVSEVNENNNQWITMPLPITPTPTPQPTGTPIPTATLTSTLLATNTPLATAMPTPTIIPVALPTSTMTLAPVPTSTAIYAPTITPTAAPATTPTQVAVDTPSITPTQVLGSPRGLQVSCNTPTQANSPVNCQASASEGKDVMYSWNFGDGSSTAQGASVTHSYSTPGDYLVTVIASNSVGSGSYLFLVLITDAPVNGISIIHDSPILVNNATLFTATVQSGTNLAFSWSFSDGATYEGSIITHSFQTTGTHQIQLRVYNSVSEQSISKSVTVNKILSSQEDPILALSPLTGCGGDIIEPVNREFEQTVLALMNTRRTEQGLSPLTLNTALANAARYHAADMAKDDYFNHKTLDRVNSQLTEICNWSDRVNVYYPSYSGLAENIASGYPSPESVMEGWMNSSGHRANVLGNYQEVGIGFYNFYWVTDFGTSNNNNP